MGDDFQHLAANFQLSFSKVTDYRPHNAPHLVTNAPQALSLWFVNDSKETNQFAMLLLIIPLTAMPLLKTKILQMQDNGEKPVHLDTND